MTLTIFHSAQIERFFVFKIKKKFLQAIIDCSLTPCRSRLKNDDKGDKVA